MVWTPPIPNNFLLVVVNEVFLLEKSVQWVDITEILLNAGRDDGTALSSHFISCSLLPTFLHKMQVAVSVNKGKLTPYPRPAQLHLGCD